MLAKVRCRVITAVCSIIVASVLVGTPLAIGAAQREANLDKATAKLFEAVHANDFAGVQASIAAGADIQAVDQWRMTPVELAVDHGYYRIAHFLVSVQNSHRGNNNRPAVPLAVSTPSPANASDEGLRSTPPQPQMVSPAGSSESAVNSTESAMVSASATLRPSSGKAYTPAWPAGMPNPFDPSVPAPGASLSAIGEVR